MEKDPGNLMEDLPRMAGEYLYILDRGNANLTPHQLDLEI
jgi:hypothetical protein